jgi:hypothetical protein
MIKINDIEYKLKYTLRALFIYEQITNKPFKFEGLYSEYILFYCILLANNTDTFTITFDKFIDICDEYPNLFMEFRKWLLNELEKQAIFINDKEDSEEGKKKN